jgi:hypothetical protein
MGMIMVTRLWAAQLKFGSWHGLGIFLLATELRPPLGPTKPLIQWVLKVLSLGVKLPGHEAGQSLPSSAIVKNTSSWCVS